MGKIDGGLRKEFRKHVIGFDWQSIESATTGGGIPDSNWCHKGREGWIEFKQTNGWAVTLEPAQIGWIARRVRHGGRVHVAVRRRTQGGPRVGPPVDQLWLFSGALAVPARTSGLRGAWAGEAHRWDGGPSSWDWDAVAEVLRAQPPEH